MATTKHIMNSNHRCGGEGLCLVSPHPDLLSRLAAGGQGSTITPSLLSVQPHLSRLSSPTGTTLGLNDGVIFPESHFADTPSTTSLTTRMSRAALERAPLRGAVRVAIVLVDFSDKSMGANASQRFKDLLFSTGRTIPTGSVTEYYADVSGGQISLTGEVIGPFRMPQTSSYYANGQSGRGQIFPNIRNLAADALTAANASGQINFQPYDNDRNGYVDAFIVVHAGSGAEQTGNVNDIWSAKWVLPQEVTVNAVKVFGFLTIPEDAHAGVCAHELGHLLFGWPDLYDIDNPRTGIIGVISAGIGNWCLMSAGSWGALPGNPAGTTPCHPSAWCKAKQGWVNVVTETDSRSITLPDVKMTPRDVHRLWRNGDTTSKEYFLIENREKVGFDESLPGAGLLVWHIDDAMTNNRDETHFWVGLMQADGLNQLATASGGRGDDGDPFPGRANNTSFNFASNPNSRAYSGQDSYVSITDISPAAQNMSMLVSVRSFSPVYAQGEPGNGIGGFDLRSRADLSFAFDYDSSGKTDHLVLYRPGTGTCWILGNSNGAFHAKYARGDPGNGIGGYDLQSPADRALAFDYDSSGKLDHLVFYRPGRGAIFIIKQSGAGLFTPVYAQGDGGHGIGGFDLRSADDKVFAFDYNRSGKQDHLCLYRPGTGTMWILRNTGGNFQAVYAQGDPGLGIGGFDLRSPADRAFAFDWDGSGKMDHIALYRPGTGTFWCLRNDLGTFRAVIAEGSPGRGIGGYDLRSPADVVFAFDWDGSGKLDHIALYRPGTGTFWCLRNRGGILSPVFAEGDPGRGVGGYDLRSTDDKIFAFDYDHSGKLDHLVLYRTNASGTIWILKRS